MDYKIDLRNYQKLTLIKSDDIIQVFKVIEIRTGKIFAATTYSIEFDETNKDEFIQIINAIFTLSHPSIVKFIGYSTTNFNQESGLVIISKYISKTTLDQVIQKENIMNNLINLSNTRNLINIFGIASAILYLKEHNIKNINLNFRNIYEMPNCNLKINDLISTKLKFSKNGFTENSDDEYQSIADIISLGIIIYSIIMGKKPFSDEKLTDNEIFEKILNGNLPDFDKEIEPQYKELILTCFITDSFARPTIKEIVDQLESDPKFITEKINKEKFYEFVNLTKSYKEEEEDDDDDEDIPRIDISQFEIIEKIGSGAFSEIYKIKNRETGLIFAAKLINEYRYEPFSREFNFLSQLTHPFILKFVGISKLPERMIVTEYQQNRSLQDIIELERNNVSIPFWNDTMKIVNIYGIALAMSYLHSKDILHLDVKPANILLDDFLLPKLCDFGLAMKLSEINQPTKLNGTTMYIAPEFFIEGKITKASDVYSFAITMFEILTSQIPYEYMNEFIIMYKVSQNERPIFEKNIPKVFKDLIESCWDQDPEKRPTFDDIVNDLKTNPKFVTESVNGELFHFYINLIDQQLNSTNEISNQNFPKYDIDPYYQYYLNILRSKEYSLDNITPLDINEFTKIGKEIGSGTYGEVFKIKNKDDGSIYAAKQIKAFCANIFDEKKRIIFTREVNILSKLSHPCIIKLIGYSPFNFEGHSKSVIVTEFVPNGSLESVLELERDEGPLPFWTGTMRLINIYGIATAMSYLHSFDIIHRDIKPHNVLVDQFLFPKLCDFGFAKFISSEDVELDRINSYGKGTPLYAAPEIFLGEKQTKGVDVYSFAILVYEVITKTVPLSNLDKYVIQYFVAIEEKRPEIGKEVPEAYRELIESCWKQKPEERLTFDAIVERLKNDRRFITSDVDESLYRAYIDFIDRKLRGEAINEIESHLFTKYS